jgi:hypothetical protein
MAAADIYGNTPFSGGEKGEREDDNNRRFSHEYEDGEAVVSDLRRTAPRH